MLQNAEISPITLLKSVFITEGHLTITKIIGTLTENICSGVSLIMVKDGRIGQVESFKGTLLKIIFWELSTTFKTTVFPNIYWNYMIFL